MERQLMRSRKNNMLAGVCGGLSEYLNIDVNVVRVLWVVFALADGPALLVYILCALFIPKAPLDYDYDQAYKPYEDQDKKVRSKSYMGLGFIAIGVYLAMKVFIPALDLDFAWPVVLIGIGVLLIRRDSR